MDNLIRIIIILSLLGLGMYFDSVTLLILSGVILGMSIKKFGMEIERIL